MPVLRVFLCVFLESLEQVGARLFFAFFFFFGVFFSSPFFLSILGRGFVFPRKRGEKGHYWGT